MTAPTTAPMTPIQASMANHSACLSVRRQPTNCTRPLFLAAGWHRAMSRDHFRVNCWIVDLGDLSPGRDQPGDLEKHLASREDTSRQFSPLTPRDREKGHAGARARPGTESSGCGSPWGSSGRDVWPTWVRSVAPVWQSRTCQRAGRERQRLAPLDPVPGSDLADVSRFTERIRRS